MEASSNYGSYRSVAFRTWSVGEASRLFAAKMKHKKAKLADHEAEKRLIKKNCQKTNLINSSKSSKTKTLLNKKVSNINLFSENKYALPNTPLKTNLSLKNIDSIDFLNLTLPNPKFYRTKSLGFSNDNTTYKKMTEKKKNIFKHFTTPDCYFSTEYVQFCESDLNENVIADSRMCNQNKSSKSINNLDNIQQQQKLIHSNISSQSVYLNKINNNNIINVNSNDSNFNAFQSFNKKDKFNCGFGSIPSQMSQSVNDQITLFYDNNIHYSTMTNLQKKNMYPLASNFLAKNKCESMINIKINSTPNTFQRQKVEFDRDKHNLFEKKNFFSVRTKSLDDVAKFNVKSKTNCALTFNKTTKEALTLKNTGTFQSVKNFLHKLYSNSTLKLKNLNNSSESTLPISLQKQNINKCKQNIVNSNQFQTPISSFYEFRIPQKEELQFLPYNINYQIDNKNKSDVLNLESDTETKTLHFDKTPKTFIKQLNQNLSKIDKQQLINNEKTTINYISPDEGVYSSSSDSGSNTDNLIDTTNFCINYNKNNFIYNKNIVKDQDFDNFFLNTSAFIQQKPINKNCDNFNTNNRDATVLNENKHSVNLLPPAYAKITNYKTTNNANKLSSNFLLFETNQNDLKKNKILFNSNTTVFPTKFTSNILKSNNASLNESINSIGNNNINKNTLINNVNVLNINDFDDSILASTSTLTHQPYSVLNQNYTNNNLLAQSCNIHYNINNLKNCRSLSVEPNLSLRINLNKKNYAKNNNQNYYNNKILSTNDLRFTNVMPSYNKNSINNNNNNTSENLIDLYQYLKKEISDMRSSDAEIWQNLKRIETELNNVVKNQNQ